MAELKPVFERLKSILKRHEETLSVVSDDPEYVHLGLYPECITDARRSDDCSNIPGSQNEAYQNLLQ